jgi:hypothetical protein
MNATGIIRKISVGDIKEGITYKVGQSMMGGRLVIEGIIQNLETASPNLKYEVYVTESGSSEVRLWKQFINVPISLEYDISSEYETAE